MNKKYGFVKRFSLFLSVFILLFTACKENIGLGESIDTKAPSLEITYPVQKAVIMDYFYIGGNCSDDKGVKNVQVTLKKLDTVQETIGSYPAEIKNGTEWFIKFNEKNSEGLYPLKDGSYIAEVTAWDNAGQNSGTSSISFDIDNTPPVFIATNPGVTESKGKYAKYGSSFTLKGTKADEHSVAKIAVTVYDENGIVKGNTDVEPFIETNVSTDEIEILFARANGFDQEKKNYGRIYDMSENHYGTEEKYSCSITLQDNAKLYQKIGDGGKEKGNSTSTIFLNDDIYDSLLSPSKGFALTANSIMTVLNGTRTESFKKGSESEGSVSTITVAQVLEILDQNKKVTFSENNEETDRLQFSLNPKANPTWNTSSELKFNKDSMAALLARSSVDFTVELGLDKVNLMPGTFNVWIKEYEEIPEENTALNDRLLIEDYVYKNKTEIPSGWVNLYKAEEDQPSSSVACTIKFSLEDTADVIKLKSGKFYLFALTGYDQENVTVEAEDLYGFVCESSGKKPEISITSPVLLPSETSKMFASAGNIEITGTANSTEDSLSALKVVLTASKNGEPLEEEFSSSISFDSGKWTEEDCLYFENGYDKAGSGTWHFVPSKMPDLEKFAAQEGDSCVYSFTFFLRAENESQEKTFVATVDAISPKVYITAVSPIVKGSDYIGEENSDLYVNGIIKFEGRIEESNLEKASWKIVDDKEEIIYSSDFSGKPMSFSTEIDTAKILKDGTQFEIIVTALDSVGNSGSHSSREYNEGRFYIVEQNSDRPVVQLKNAYLGVTKEEISAEKNSFEASYAVQVINGTVQDDDGISLVRVNIFDEEQNKALDEQTFRSSNKTTSFDFKFNLPRKEGFYWIEIAAEDKNYQDDETTPFSVKTVEKFPVLIDNSVPVIEFDGDVKDYEYVREGSLEFKVNVKDQVLKEISVGISKDNEEVLKEYYKPNIEEGYVTITVPVSENDGSWSFTVNAEDILNKMTAQNFGPFIIDTVDPEITQLNSPQKQYADRTSVQIFTGSITEVTSGIKDVKFYSEGTKDGEKYTTLQETASIKGSKDDAGNITENITFQASVSLEDFDENTAVTIYFEAEDNAGRTSEKKSAVLNLDATKPSVTFASWDDSNPYTKQETLPLSGTVTEKNLSSLELFVVKDDGESKSEKKWTADEIPYLSTGNAEEWSYTYNANEDGKYYFVLTAEDKAGLKDSVTSKTVYVDTTGPGFSVDNSNITEIFDTSTYTFTGTWSDNLSGTKELYYSIDNGTASAAITDYAGQKKWSIEIPLTEEGVHTFTFWGKDRNGNESDPVVMENVLIDFARPEVSEKPVLPEYLAAEKNLTKETVFTDTYGIKEIICKASLEGNLVTEGFNFEQIIDESTKTTGTGKITIEANDSFNGKWTFLLKAVDLAGRESEEIELSITTDSVKPEPLLSDDENYPFLVQGKPAADSWYRQNSLTFRGYFRENGSGIKTVWYFIKNNSSQEVPVDLTEENAADGYFDVADDKSVGEAVSYGITTDKFEAGTNTIYVQSVDKAGNKSRIIPFTVKVDMDSPEFDSVFYTFDENPVESSFNGQASGTVLANGKNNIVLFGTVADTGSGIEKIDFYLGGKIEDSKIEDQSLTVFYTTNELTQSSLWKDFISADYEVYNAENASLYKGWKAIISKDKVKTGSLYAMIFDIAENSLAPQIFTINLDNNSPEVKISTSSNSKLVKKSVVSKGTTVDTEPSDGEIKSINGETSFSGTATDDYTISSIKLYWSTENNGTDYSSDTFAGILEGTNAYSWNFKHTVSSGIELMNGIKFTGQPQKVWFKFVCSDTAANESVYVYEYSVDPNADRPVFNITNLSSAESGEIGNILKYDTVLTGTVTDDDDLTDSQMKIYELFEGKVRISESQEQDVIQNKVPSTSEEWASFAQKENTLKYNKTTGDWSYTPLTTQDGKKEIYIYFKDGKGAEFWTCYDLINDNSLSSEVLALQNRIYTPKVQLKRVEQENFGSTEVLSYSTDGNSPEITGFKIAVGKTKNEAENAAFEDITGEYGGTEKRFARIQISARDENGIKDLTAKLNETELSFTSSNPTVDSSPSVWVTETVDLSDSAYRSETISLVAKAWDGSDLFSNRTGTINNDYEIPENFSIVLPKSKLENNGTRITQEILTGSQEISGTANDGNGSGLKSIKWLIPLKGQTLDTLIADYAEGNDYDSYIQSVETADSKYNWIDFETYGNSTLSEWKLSFDGEEGRSVLKDFCDTAKYEISLSNYIYSIPMIFRLEDNLGNVRIVSNFVIQFNPNADWPVAKIIYPTTADGTDSQGNKLTTKVGGTVRVTGSATDNISVSKVYVQISTTKNQDGSIVWNKEDQAIKDARTNAETQNDSEYFKTVDLTGLSGLAADSAFDPVSDGWGILASNSISWFLEINKYGELDSKSVWIRSAAVDINANGQELNLGLWSDPQYVEFDANVPILGKQAASNIISVFNENSVGQDAVISRTYTSDMHISNKDGKWYFALSAEDNSGIKGIIIKKTVGGNTAETVCNATWASGEEKEGDKKTVNGVIFESHQYAYEYEENGTPKAKSYYDKLIYLPVDTASDGYISYTVTASEGTDTELYSSGTYTFNIDNSAPQLTPLVSEDTRITNSEKLVAGNKLVNSNGSRITLSGKVEDSGAGFDKLALYFIRNGNLLNPFPESSGTGWVSTQAQSVPVSGLSTSENAIDGLHGKKITGTIEASDNSFTAETETDISSDRNIRTGGLAKINGSYYIITKKEGGKVWVNADIPLVSKGNNSDEVFFPYAFVVQYNTSWINKEDFSSSTNYASPVYYISEDDKDGIMQNIEKDGTTWNWSIYIPSHLIPDGEIKVCWTAFDKAGNSSCESADTMISNNLPRISKVFLATDLNGNGEFDDSEFAYTSVNDSGNETVHYGYSALDINEKPQEIISGINTDYTYIAEDGSTKDGFFFVREKLDVAVEFTSGGTGDLYVYPSLGTQAAEGPVEGADVSEKLSSFTNLTNVKAQKHISIETSKFSQLPNYDSSMENNAEQVKSLNGKSPVLSYLQLDIWDNVNIASNDSGKRIATKDITDSGTGLVTTYGNQFTVLNIPFYLDITDDNSPEILFNSPSAKENEGHVELGDDSVYTEQNGTLDNDDKISGKVIFTGVLQDDRKIASVKLKSSYPINSSLTTEVEVASYDENTALLKTTDAAKANAAWKFEIITEDSNQFSKSEGHRVEWKLTLDSSFVENTAQNDVEFTLSASDASEKGNSGSKEKQVDIVPYITHIETSLSSVQKRNPSVFDRTAHGHYPVNEGETINIYGYNLKGGAFKDSAGTEISLGTGTRTTDSPVYGITGTEYYTVQLTTSDKQLVSGKMSVVVNQVSSINNSNNNSLEQNRKPNGVNNNLLTDDVIIDVWQFNSEAAVPISGKIEQPVMKIRPTDGKIGFAFVNGPLYFSMGGSSTSEDYSYQYWMGSYDFFTSVGFTYDDAGNSWGVAAGGDINASHADKFVLMGSKWGVGGYHKDGTYYGINSKRLESIGMKGTKTYTTDTTENFDKQRIRSPSLASTVHSGYTNLYMAYYDTMNDELRFKAGRETEQTAQSYVFRVIRCDTPDSNYAGAWVVPPNNDTSLLADGDTIYLCDENGNVTDTTAYTLTGYWKGNFATTGQVAFKAKLGDLVCKPFPGTEALKYSENGNFHVFDQGENAYIKVVKSAKSFTGGSFIDYDTKPAPEAYRNGTVSIVAGDGVANYGAGEYVSLAAIPGSDVNNDKVVITWYDTNARTLYYSYNETPLTERNGTFNKADGTTGWSTPVAVFSGNEDHEYAGEYCKIAVDKNGGIHIAAYDPVNLDLVYAYASAYNASFTTCVVDSNGVVGSNLTLDVALENGRVSPYIGYYATSCIKPKIAFYTGENPAGETALVHGFTSSPENGSSEDLFTGNWECSVVPTSKVVEMQSNQHNDINIGVWKDSSGIRKASSTGTSSVTNSPNSYDSTSNGQIWGNGTANPVLGYAVKKGSSGDTIETAQLK